MRDARPFVAYHLRERAETPGQVNADDLQLLARWVENLRARDPRMALIEATDALCYDNGELRAGDEAEALIDGYNGGDDPAFRDAWLTSFADAVARFHR